MPGDFRFKQFYLKQSPDVMPLSTDAILLGSWTNITNEKKILDAGTGSGILSLMLAQRFPRISIFAIDSSVKAVELSRENFLNSNWKDRLSVEEIDFLNCIPESAIDHIISNPPFFEKSLASVNPGIREAKHISSFSPNSLLNKAPSILTSTGKISLIVEYSIGKKLLENCRESGFLPIRITEVKSKPSKQAQRLLIELVRSSENIATITMNTISIYDHTGKYSNEYKELSRAFYLK